MVRPLYIKWFMHSELEKKYKCFRLSYFISNLNCISKRTIYLTLLLFWTKLEKFWKKKFKRPSDNKYKKNTENVMFWRKLEAHLRLYRSLGYPCKFDVFDKKTIYVLFRFHLFSNWEKLFLHFPILFDLC